MKKYLLIFLFILLLFVTTGCKKSIVGRWKSINTDDEFYYIFNSDNTCYYEMSNARLDCTYQDDGEKISILFKGNINKNIYNYSFKKNTLIIKDNDNNIYKFKKSKNK
jgi:hypothetical protein